MGQKDKITKLETKVNYFINRIEEHGKCLDAEYYWNKFEVLLAWAKKFDANSKEYEELLNTAWLMLDKYLKYLTSETFGGKK